MERENYALAAIKQEAMYAKMKNHAMEQVEMYVSCYLKKNSY